MSTIYASFSDAHEAEKAAGALLDRGARSGDISILANSKYHNSRSEQIEAAVSEATAKSGLTTTTPEDAAMGAVKGTMTGLGVGILAAAATLFIPGFGIVLGGGALATAFGATLASAGAGAIAGGVTGFLKDQGVGEDQALRYTEALHSGGALLAINIPTGDLTGEEIEPYLVKYGAQNVATVNEPRNLIARSEDTSTQPISPLELSHPTIHPSSGGSAEPIVTQVETQRGDGVVIQQPMVIEPGGAPITPRPAFGFSIYDVTPLESDPVSGRMVRGYVIDPNTGERRDVRMVGDSLVYADRPVSD